MRLSFFIALSIVLVGLAACNDTPVNPGGSGGGGGNGGQPTVKLPTPDPQYPGGGCSNLTAGGGDLFGVPCAQSFERNSEFHAGNAFFREAWVIAPSSTITRDGLGPLYNQVSCTSCHFKDGRGRSPAPGEDTSNFNAMLIRISVADGHGFSKPDPVYGDQLEPYGVAPTHGVPGEADQWISWKTFTGYFADGTPYKLYKPTITLRNFNYGPPGFLYKSARIAPQLIGMGLLEAIKVEDLEKKEDPNDKDGDGISGRLVRIHNHPLAKPGEVLIGRFGWKAEQPLIAGQNAAAFWGDMGITTEQHPYNNCPPDNAGGVGNVGCKKFAALHKGLEAPPHILNLVTTYVSLLSVPPRRGMNSPLVKKGETIFHNLGCDSCHTPSYITGKHRFPELSYQAIFPYTDLLVHDMGAGLSDGRPAFDKDGAGPSEWRTPPLWGIGLIKNVNGRAQFLHDGRAATYAQAILWHGGEAQKASDKFKQLSSSDRQALYAFINSL